MGTSAPSVARPARRLAALLSGLVLFGLACSRPPQNQVSRAAPPSAKGLTLERLYSLPRLIGTAPSGFAWSGDSRRVAFLWNDGGLEFRDVWVVDAAEPESRPVRWTRLPRWEVEEQLVGNAAEGEEESSPDPFEDAVAAERVERDPGATAVVWHPDGERLLVSFRGDLWLVGEGEEPQRLTETESVESQAAYSLDGESLGFLRDGDLWLVDAGGLGEARRRTRRSGPVVAVASFRWSPDGQRLAILEADRSDVPIRGIPDYLAEETELDLVPRAYPGEPTVRQRVGVLPASSGAVDWIELTGSEMAPEMILSYRWSPDGRRLAVDTSDLYAKDRQIFVSDLPALGSRGAPLVRLLARDADPLNETFYFWRIDWSMSGDRLYFLSDRSQDYHLWSVAVDGGEPQQLTRGPWAVAEIHPVPDGVLAVGNRGRAEERRLFLVGDDGAEPVQVSELSGTHRPAVAPDGSVAAVAFSSDAMPPEMLLTRLDRGAETAERRITTSPLAEFDDYRWVTPEYVSFPSHVDGTTLHGRLTLPPGFDSRRSYPAILGSVYTDSVRNQWGGRTAHPTWGLDQFLAQQGYVLLNVDMRGSWGRGREHRRGIRLDYGGMDIEDLESGVRYLGSLGYVDVDRVGIWGSSYGGLMTAMSLFRKPELYAAGVAGAPATNVRHALTGQMAVMMRPEDQPAEYDDSSPYLHADGLEDPLMIIHGMRDRVVLYKDSVVLTQRLLQLGKDVDLVTLPAAGHGWDNEGLAQTRYAFGRLVQHFDRHLRPDPQP